MTQEKDDVSVVERVETAQQEKDSLKDSKEKAICEEVETLKLKFHAKVNMLIEDEDLRQKLHELVSEAVDEAVIWGQVKGVPDDVTNSVTETFENVARNFGCLSSSVRAETYKKLFHNQRIISAHLMSAAQLLQLQIGDTESLIIPDFNSIFGTMEKTFAPSPIDGIAK